MKLKHYLKMTAVCCAIIFAPSCQKSIVVETDDVANGETLPRAAVPDRRTNYIGYGYDVTGAHATRSGTRHKVIDVDRIDAELGAYQGGPTEWRTNKNEFAAHAREYSRKVSNKVSVTAGLSVFGANIGGSYSSSNQGSNSYDGKYVYAEKVVTIRKRHDALNATSEELRRYLTPQFEHHLNTQTPAWIIRNYGTHIMKNIYSGGKLFVLFRGENSSIERTSASRSSITVSSGFLFDLETEFTSTEDTRLYNETTNKEVYYEMTGGNASISIGSGTINLQHGIRRMSTAAWQSSVSYQNAELVDFANDGLIPIWEIISDPQKRFQIQYAALIYMSSNSTKDRYNTVPIYSLYRTGTWPTRAWRENHMLSLVPDRRFFENHGINFYVFDYQVPGTMPLYEYVHTNYNNNIYSLEANSPNLINQRYIMADRICYVYPQPSSTNGTPTKPVHVYYNPNSVNHYFTTHPSQPAGYNREAPWFHAH